MGLVTAHSNRPSATPPPPQTLLKSNPINHYNDQHQHQGHENAGTPTATTDSPSSPNSSSYRPLNVIDALAYLDQVKGRFSDKPNVYNQFLDIMKDFKSQSIDTPGVIERVSTLFKGHPLLISGFNTFLPAGYRIECSVDPRDPNRIIVTTPNGNTTTSTTTTAEELLKINPPPPPPPSHYYHSQSYAPSTQSYSPANTLPPPPPIYANSYTPPSLPPPPPPPATTSTMRPSSVSPPPERRPPVEFNHAINYVNRIKNRFATNPDIYKQFLEILQTYQKEQKPIGEVYAHVQYLFNGAEDLLEEFKQFLPEISQQPSYGVKRTGSLPPGAGGAKKKKTYMTKKSRSFASSRADEMEEDTMSFSAFDPQKPCVSLEETELFEKIKKHIGTKPSYEEFLKTLNLYTQQIVDMDLLIVQLKAFLGNNKELFDAFKQAIGYDPKEHPIERPTLSALKPDLIACATVASSPSYRVVPKEWQNQPCSGRDQMCWEVLNDEYVSHPIWASEDSGFVASKKNQYEEALHRCEEERYEYDLNIEANLNTIALLEPLALKIESMTHEEQNNMRLSPGLGGPTVSIYERIIKKVYDNERGNEIIEMLYEKPATVIPVLLKRLKMKDKEWKKAQREWNKIWRELDSRNFYKSLDYQGASFKTNDKKTLVNKVFISEIENLSLKNPGTPQYTFDTRDASIFKDITKLISHHMDHQTGFTKVEKQRIRGFLKTFMPTFFHIEYDEHDTHMDEDDVQSNADDSDADSSPQSNNHHKDKKLLRGAIMRSSSQSNGKSPVVKTEQDMDEDVEMSDEVVGAQGSTPEQEEMNLFAAAAAAASDRTIKERTFFTFFCNSPFFCLFRLIQVLNERLSKMKSLDQQIQSNPDLSKKFNRTAVELDLYANRFEDLDLSNGCYSALMDTIIHFFEGELDQGSFEESIRYIFGIDAYVIFTVDKVILSLIKQIQTVAADRKTKALMKAYTDGLQSSEPRALSAYRSNVEEILGGTDENIYKITLDTETQTTSMQLLDRQKEAFTQQEMYEEYMANYVDWINDTKGIDRTLLKPSFLQRNLKPQEKRLSAFVRPELRYKIQQESYHMYYIVGSEDVFSRITVPSSSHHKRDTSKWDQLVSKNGHLSLPSHIFN